MTEAPPHVQVLRMIVGKWTSAALSALARLGVPDNLESGPRSNDELAPI